MLLPPTCWDRTEILPAADLADRAVQAGLDARIVPGFPRYAHGLLVILSPDHRWALPLHPDNSVRRYEVFEPSDCQWQRWLLEWQDMAARWRTLDLYPAPDRVAVFAARAVGGGGS